MASAFSAEILHVQDAASVSAIITTYDSGQLLPRCVESVLSQTVRPLEIIVIDDASNQDPASVLAPYGTAVKLIRRHVNGGPSAARNDGVLAAKGSWVAFLDSDDRWVPEKIERQLEAAAAFPETSVFYSDCLQLDADGRRLKNYHADKQPQSGCVTDALIDHIFVLPSTMMVRRQALLDIGGFDVALRGAEDHDLCLRLSLEGHTFQCVSEPLTVYQRQPQSLSRNHCRMLDAQARTWAKLFTAGLTPEQFLRVRRMLASIHFDLGYLLRPISPRDSMRHAAISVKYQPGNLTAWKLLAANTARRFLQGSGLETVKLKQERQILPQSGDERDQR